jgi:hypothetical protein
MSNEVHKEPSDVSVEDGHVVIHCPEGQTFTFTPDAAVITSDRLLQAGLQAKRNEIESDGDEAPATELGLS